MAHEAVHRAALRPVPITLGRAAPITLAPAPDAADVVHPEGN